MRKTLLWTVLGLCRGRTGRGGPAACRRAEERKPTDARENRAGPEVVIGRVRAMDELEAIRKQRHPRENLDDPQKEREKQLGKTLEPVLEDACKRRRCAIQSFLLAHRQASDRGGDAVEDQFLLFCSMKTGVPLKELSRARRKSGLGIGGVILGATPWRRRAISWPTRSSPTRQQ